MRSPEVTLEVLVHAATTALINPKRVVRVVVADERYFAEVAIRGRLAPVLGLPAQYRSKGLQFTKEGYPDFAPHAKQLPNGKNYVEIEYTGGRTPDFKAANKKARLKSTPDGYIWHHAEDMKTMYLVPEDLHDAVKHTGGVAKYKHATGIDEYGD